MTFDSTVFESIFPDTPPTDVQGALDFAFVDYVSESQGGTITKDQNALNLQGITADSCYVRFNNESGSYLGHVGKTDGSNTVGVGAVVGDVSLISDLGLVIVTAGTAANINAAAAINLTAAATNVNSPLNVETDAGAAINIQQVNDGDAGYLQWRSSTASPLGYMGYPTDLDPLMQWYNPVGGCTIRADGGNIDLTAPVVNLNAATTNLNGNVNIPANNILNLNAADAGVGWHISEQSSNGFFKITRTENGSQIINSLWIDAADDCYITGDVTAFTGLSANAAPPQPLIAATGKLTSFELIEHLLDKIEDMETTISDLSIRLDNGGL